MKHFISHRGNIEGPNPVLENNPEYIISSLNKGFECEIDVWWINGWFLGHDVPHYSINEQFLENPKLWCHAKNLEALVKMLANKKIHCFWHQNDDFTVTSHGIIWAYPGKELSANSICVLPERSEQDTVNALGICSDFISRYK